MRILSDLIQYFQGIFPNQKAQNATTPTSRDGTEWNKPFIDDYILGPTQALLDAAGLVPNGQAENPNTSQYVEAISIITSQWREGLKYTEGSKVLFSGAWHIATAPNTAEVDNAPDKVGAPWVELELWQRDKMIPIGYIYLNKTDNTNPSALANPWPGDWATLRPSDYLAIQGGRYAINTQYNDGLPNIVGEINESGTYNASGIGAFTLEVNNSSESNRNMSGQKIIFNASNSNPIYNHDQEVNGNPDPHVQPQTLGVAGFVKTSFAY